jgi:hypothetical protein
LCRTPDTDYGFVEVVNLSTNTTTQVTTTKGRYGMPKFSSNGQFLSFVRYGADSLSGPLYGRGSGVYIVDLLNKTDTPRLLVSGGAQISRVSDNGDVDVSFGDGSLTAATFDSKSFNYSQTEVFGSGFSTEIAVSANDEWVAFVEFYEVYVARKPKIAGKDQKAPVLTARTAPDVKRTDGAVRISRNGGFFLSFSPDSQKLYYLIGPSLHIFDLKQLESCRESLDCLVSSQTQINLTVTETTASKKLQPEGKFSVIDNISLVYTMDSKDTNFTNARILIQGEVIVQIGPAASVQIPAGAFVYDAQGGTFSSLPAF